MREVGFIAGVVCQVLIRVLQVSQVVLIGAHSQIEVAVHEYLQRVETLYEHPLADVELSAQQAPALWVRYFLEY